MYCPQCGHTMTGDGCSNSQCPSNNDYIEMGRVYNYVESTKKDRIEGVLNRIKTDLQELERLINER